MLAVRSTRTLPNSAHRTNNPSLVNSMEGAKQLRVAVVGGGLAGLAAAQALSGFCDVVVLEAAPAMGGRIKHITGLVPWPVEIGPEFLHGKQNSSIMRIADEIGCKLKELPYPDRYYIGSERRLLNSEEADEHCDIQSVHRLFAELANEIPPVPDLSMAEFLQRKGVNDTVIQLAQSIYANDFGCSLQELGVSECILEAQQWIYGDTYVVLDRPVSCIVDRLAKGLNVCLNHPVEEITYSLAAGVELRCKEGVKVHADYAIVTVSVKVLQQRMISFDPPLPRVKLEAASIIGMSNALKVFVAFSHRFWPKDMFDVVCTSCFIPEFWATQYPSASECTPALGKHLLVGFMAGDVAVAASRLSHDEIFSRSLSQLDEIFGSSVESDGGSHNRESLAKATKFLESHEHDNFNRRNSAEAPKFYTRARAEGCSPVTHPASFYFVGGFVVDWAEEPFIRGGYTHPSVNAHGSRRDLAEPVLGRLFFAGEATHPGVNPCMQAAIDTGVRAAEEIMAIMKP